MKILDQTQDPLAKMKSIAKELGEATRISLEQNLIDQWAKGHWDQWSWINAKGQALRILEAKGKVVDHNMKQFQLPFQTSREKEKTKKRKMMYFDEPKAESGEQILWNDQEIFTEEKQKKEIAIAAQEVAMFIVENVPKVFRNPNIGKGKQYTIGSVRYGVRNKKRFL
jgi:hypothetical protein